MLAWRFWAKIKLLRIRNKENGEAEGEGLGVATTNDEDWELPWGKAEKGNPSSGPWEGLSRDSTP